MTGATGCSTWFNRMLIDFDKSDWSKVNWIETEPQLANCPIHAQTIFIILRPLPQADLPILRPTISTETVRIIMKILSWNFYIILLCVNFHYILDSFVRHRLKTCLLNQWRKFTYNKITSIFYMGECIFPVAISTSLFTFSLLLFI